MKQKRFRTLPPGAVKARGFLLNRLENQRDHFTDEMERHPDFSSESGWLGGTGEDWERGPYYVRGLTALAYVLGDEKLIARATKWIDYALSAQDGTGNFYPHLPGGAELEERRKRCRENWWARMPMLMAIRDFYEGELLLGREDPRILPFFERYFLFEYKTLLKNPLNGFWEKARAADNAEVCLWYYGKSGKEWLLDLARLLLEQGDDWVSIFSKTSVPHHVVNTTQAYRYPYLRYLLTGEETDRLSLFQGLENIRRTHGRIDGLPNADEGARDNLFHRGTETCAVAEAMLSMEINGEITGETVLYDYLENYAYNALPNCYWYDMSRYAYFFAQNQVLAGVGYHDFLNDHGDSSAYGYPSGFECCFSNGHMAYPKFVQNMWMEDDEGLILTCYGANRVERRYNGRIIAFEQRTAYPYGDDVELLYCGEPARFSLRLRIPSWCGRCEAEFGGRRFSVTPKEEYLALNEVFSPGDIVHIRFFPEIEMLPWHYDAVAVRRGVLLYSLPVKEDKITHEKAGPYREIVREPEAGHESFSLYPASQWNYALLPEKPVYQENPAAPYMDPECPPCEIFLYGVVLPEWGLEGNWAQTPQQMAGRWQEKNSRKLRLTPYSHSRLRIALFPRAYRLDGDCPVLKGISFHRFFEGVQLDYPTLREADTVLISISAPGEDETLFAAPKRQYQGVDSAGFFPQRDTVSFRLQSEREVWVVLYYMKKGRLVRKSEVIAIPMLSDK